MSNEHKPLTAAEIASYKRLIVSNILSYEMRNFPDVCAEDFARLLAMLTPPADAEVREAVEAAQVGIAIADDTDQLMSDIYKRHLRTLLSHVRAVQSPLTEGQVEAVKWAERFITEHGGQASAWVDERHSQGESEEIDRDMDAGLANLRAAFPALLGKEG